MDIPPINSPPPPDNLPRMQAMANVRVFATPYYRQIAGFWQHGGITITTFYKWFGQFFATPAQGWALYPADPDPNRCGEPAGPALQRDQTDILTPGDYVLLDGDRKLCRAALAIEDPCPYIDLEPNTRTHHETDFTRRVCKRDTHCCLTGKEVPYDVQTKSLNCFGFEVAQIFPLSARTEFYRLFSGCIMDPDVGEDDKMTSVQLGFLVCSDWYGSFDNYEVGVDPDDGYRITDFRPRIGPSLVDGRTFCIDPDVPQHYRPSPELLRDHFRRCLLASVRILPYRDIVPFDPASEEDTEHPDLSSGWWASRAGRTQFHAQLNAAFGPARD